MAIKFSQKDLDKMITEALNEQPINPNAQSANPQAALAKLLSTVKK